MGRKRREPTLIKGLRLPIRLWNLLKKASGDRELTVNGLVWRMVENWLFKNGYLRDEDRKRESLTD